MVAPNNLNPFWRYVFHFIDYQSYVFQGMMVNEFAGRNYTCPTTNTPTGCTCMYDTELSDLCLIDGKGVLSTYGYNTGNTGKWVGILIGIIAAYRLLGWAVLYLRRS